MSQQRQRLSAERTSKGGPVLELVQVAEREQRPCRPAEESPSLACSNSDSTTSSQQHACSSLMAACTLHQSGCRLPKEVRGPCQFASECSSLACWVVSMRVRPASQLQMRFAQHVTLDCQMLHVVLGDQGKKAPERQTHHLASAHIVTRLGWGASLPHGLSARDRC